MGWFKDKLLGSDWWKDIEVEGMSWNGVKRGAANFRHLSRMLRGKHSSYALPSSFSSSARSLAGTGFKQYVNSLNNQGIGTFYGKRGQ